MRWLTSFHFLSLAYFASFAHARPVPGSAPSLPKPSSLNLASAPPTGPQSITVASKSYNLGPELGRGQAAVVYAVGSDQVAKKYRPYQQPVEGSSPETVAKVQADNQMQNYLYKEESTHALAILKTAMSNGESYINGQGEKYAWIIMPLVRGHVWSQSEGLKTMRKKGKTKCLEFLNRDVRPEFERKLIALEQSSKLVHLDAHQKNVFWDKDGKQIVGFIDFDDMGAVDGVAYQSKAQELIKKFAPSHQGKLTLPEMAKLFALQYYPDRFCYGV